MRHTFTASGRARRVDADKVGVHAEESDEPAEDGREEGADHALADHLEELVEAFVTLRRRTSNRLAIAWLWAARRHLDLLRPQEGTLGDELDQRGDRVDRPKDRALAGALYLLLICQELEGLEATERALVDAAYLPATGRTDREPYRGHRLPDGELAERVLGASRGHAREARDRLLAILLAMTERWWERFRCTKVREAGRREWLLAHLAWETFTPTVYDVWRLERLRPEGRGDLDFQQWRGRDVMGRNQRGRGRKPPGPNGGGLAEPVAAAYLRGDLSADEERNVARYLISRASAAELRLLSSLAENAVPGATWFERMRTLAGETSGSAIAFLVRLESGEPVPALLAGGRRALGENEVVAVHVTPAEPGEWVAVLGRVDGGALEWVLRWTLLSPSPVSTEVCGYALDEDETEVELLVAVVREARPEEEEAILALAALGEMGPERVRWGACRLGKTLRFR